MIFALRYGESLKQIKQNQTTMCIFLFGYYHYHGKSTCCLALRFAKTIVMQRLSFVYDNNILLSKDFNLLAPRALEKYFTYTKHLAIVTHLQVMI